MTITQVTTAITAQRDAWDVVDAAKASLDQITGNSPSANAQRALAQETLNFARSKAETLSAYTTARIIFLAREAIVFRRYYLKAVSVTESLLPWVSSSFVNDPSLKFQRHVCDLVKWDSSITALDSLFSYSPHHPESLGLESAFEANAVFLLANSSELETALAWIPAYYASNTDHPAMLTSVPA